MSTASKPRIVVLGAGFGGLELTTLLSEALGDGIDVTLIDKSDAFIFGYSKLDVMFGHKAPEAVRLPYSAYVKPGVRLLKRNVTAIDPESSAGSPPTTAYSTPISSSSRSARNMISTRRPGWLRTNEFYTVAGAERLRDALPNFTKGKALIGVCGAPYKCPPRRRANAR